MFLSYDSLHIVQSVEQVGVDARKIGSELRGILVHPLIVLGANDCSEMGRKVIEIGVIPMSPFIG